MSVAGRGSYLQVFTALCVSMAFIGLQLLLSPYRHHVRISEYPHNLLYKLRASVLLSQEDNLLKAASSFQEFFTIQVASLLRNAKDLGAAGELVDASFYDSAASYLFTVTVLCPAVFAIAIKIRRANELGVLQETPAEDLSELEQIQRAYAVHGLGFGDLDNDGVVAKYFADARDSHTTAMKGGSTAVPPSKTAHVYISHHSRTARRKAKGLADGLQSRGYTAVVSLPSTTESTLCSMSDSAAVTVILSDDFLDQPSCIAELHHTVINEIPMVMTKHPSWNYQKWQDVWGGLAFAEGGTTWVDELELNQAKSAFESLRFGLVPLVGSSDKASRAMTLVYKRVQEMYDSGKILPADADETGDLLDAVIKQCRNQGASSTPKMSRFDNPMAKDDDDVSD
jgi:hypothetical protein